MVAAALHRVALWLLLCGPAAPALAAIERLDDSASPRPQVNGDLNVARSVDGRSLAIPFGRVEYRLATARFLGRQARIHYVIPPLFPGLQSPAGVRLDWRGGGRFASGAGRPGDRVLVWSGIVREPWIDEALELTLTLAPDAVRLQPGMRLQLETYFDIETSP